MKLGELAGLLESNTKCDLENIELKSDENGDYIAIDEFKIRAEDDDFSVDDNDIFETFSTSGSNILEFFKGFYDAYTDDEKDEAKSNEYYDLGFDFGVESLSEDDDDDSDDEDAE
jgi:hypothetical protein